MCAAAVPIGGYSQAKGEGIMLEEEPAMVGKSLEAPRGDKGDPRKDRISVGLVINLKARE